MDYLAEAKKSVKHANEYSTQLDAHLAIAYALIAIAERLPAPAETWSKCHARLQEEDQDEL